MARYRVNQACFVRQVSTSGPSHVKAGETINVADDVTPSIHWVALDETAREAVAARDARLSPREHENYARANAQMGFHTIAKHHRDAAARLRGRQEGN
jgi:hypothetical protein